MPGYNRLFVWFCLQLSDDSLVNIGNHSPHLTTLNVQGCAVSVRTMMSLSVWGRGWLVRKALAFHQGDPCAIPGHGRESSCALVLCCATKVLQTIRFSSLGKIKHFDLWLCSVVVMV